MKIKMKAFRKLTSILLAMLLFVSVLTACSDGRKEATTKQVSNEKKDDVQALIAASLKQMREVKNFDVSLNATVNIVLQAQTISTEIDMDYTYIVDPYAVKGMMEMDMDIGTEGYTTDEFEIYAEKKDGKYFTYSKVKDADWTVAEINELEANQYNAAAQANILLESISNPKIVGTETENGAEVKEIEGVIPSAKLQGLFEATGSLENFNELGLKEITAEEFTQAFAKVSDLPIKLQIDANEYYLLKYETDMTEVMNQLLKNIFGQEIAQNLSYQEVEMSMACTNFDKVEAFEMPVQ